MAVVRVTIYLDDEVEAEYEFDDEGGSGGLESVDSLRQQLHAMGFESNRD